MRDILEAPGTQWQHSILSLHTTDNQYEIWCSLHYKSDSAEEKINVLNFPLQTSWKPVFWPFNAIAQQFTTCICKWTMSTSRWLSNHISQCIYWQCCTFEEFPLPVWLGHFISTKSRAQTSITSAALFLSSCPSVDSIGHRLGNVVFTFSSNLLPFCISLSTFESGLADWLTIQPQWVSSVFLPLRSCGEELSDSGVQRGGFNPLGCFLRVGVTTRFEIPVN